MSLTEKLEYLISANADQFISSTKKAADAADSNIGHAENKFQSIGSGMQKAGLGALAFAGVAGAALFNFAEQAGEAQAQQLKLENSLRNSPRLAGENADAFINLATAIQHKTAADGDAIVGAQAVLVQFGLTKAQILEVTPLVVDLSRKMGVDLDQAAKTVAKSIEGKSTALMKMGIQVDSAKEKDDAYAATTDALRRTVGGFAEQEGATFAGSLERMKNNLGDVAESIGSVAAPALENLTSFVGGLADKFTSLPQPVQDVIGKIAVFGTVGIGAAGALSFLSGTVLKTIANVNALRDTLGGVGSMLGHVAPAVGPVVGALALVGLAYKQVADDQARITSIADDYTEALHSQTAELERNVQAFFAKALTDGNTAEALARLGLSTQEFSAALTGGQAAQAAFTEKIFAMKRADEDLTGSVNTLWNKLGDLVMGMNQAYAASINAATANKDLGESAVLAAAQTTLSTEAFGQLQNALSDHVLTAEEAASINGDLGQVIAKLNGMLPATAAGTKDVADATGDSNDEDEKAIQLKEKLAAAYDRQMAAQLSLIDSEVGYNRAVEDVGKALGDFQKSQGEATEATKKHGESSDEAAQAQDRMQSSSRQLEDAVSKAAAQAVQYASDQATAAGATFTTQDKINAQIGALEALKVKYPELAPAIDAHIAKLNTIPDKKTTALEVTDTASQTLDEIINKLNTIRRQTVITVDATGGRHVTGGTEKAKGGPVRAGEAYTVGEKGSETFVPTENGYIIPHGVQPGPGAPAPLGGMVLNVTVNGGTDAEANAQAMVRAVTWMIKTGQIAA